MFYLCTERKVGSAGDRVCRAMSPDEVDLVVRRLIAAQVPKDTW